ncbi:MAG: signal peptidase I [Actinobacteria bacterium]|nr:signal peptidase I [Actinomycetota bacterium]
MMGMRMGAGAVGAVIVAAVAWLLVGPQQLGGPIAVVSTYGHSMAPTYQAHDLVIIRRAGNYRVGDVIAYRSGELDTVVLHRVIDRDGGRFVTQGDNNDWVDHDRPTRDDILGRAWLSVPQAGRVLNLPIPARLAVPLVLAVGAGGVAGRRAGRRTGRRPQRHHSTTAPLHKTSRTDASHRAWDGRPRQLVAIAAAGLVVAAALGAVAFTRPTRQPGTVAFTHHATLDYTAVTHPGPVYPDGKLHTGDPIFLRLIDDVALAFTWRLDGPAAADITGSGQLLVEITDASGWRRTLPAGKRTSFTGTHATLEGRLDLAALRALAGEVHAATGMAGGGQLLDVTADLQLDGTLAGAPLSTRFAPTVTFQLDDLRMVVATPSKASGDDPQTSGGDDDTTLTLSDTGSVTVPDQRATRLEIAGRGIAVGAARVVAVAVAGAALTAAAAAARAARRDRQHTESDRIHDRYRHQLLDVAGIAPAQGRTQVEVTTMDALAALAQHLDQPVLHLATRDGTHLYLVETSATRYRYRPRHPSPTAVPSHSPAPVAEAQRRGDAGPDHTAAPRR